MAQDNVRDVLVALAFAPWELITAGRLEAGLAMLDDAGTWWSNSSRETTSIAEIKPVLRAVFGLINPSFTLIDTIVEADRVALIAEARAELSGGVKFDNACTFITHVDLARNLVVEIREYVDTLHSAQTLKPAMAAAGLLG